MDTGSGLVWLPSKGCGTNCSQGLAADAGFDASASSTFQPVGCDDPSCNSTFCQECACSTSQPGSCGYSLEYMEGGTAFGAWVQDSLQLPALVLADTAKASLKFGLQQGTTGDLQQQNIHALIGACLLLKRTGVLVFSALRRSAYIRTLHSARLRSSGYDQTDKHAVSPIYARRFELGANLSR